MRAVVQRVLHAQVEVNGAPVGRIDKGLLVYLSVGKNDTTSDAEFIANKLIDLRIFQDRAGRMNRSLVDVGGQLLLVSNFTLHGDCRKGRRPGFDSAARPARARRLYQTVAESITRRGIRVEHGAFGEHMHLASVNDGPVTFLLDSSRLF